MDSRSIRQLRIVKQKKELYEATISMPEMSRLLGISRKDVYALLKSKRYGKYFSTVIIADQKRITKDSFQKFLDEQEEYQLSPCNDYKELAMEEKCCSGKFQKKETFTIRESKMQWKS